MFPSVFLAAWTNSTHFVQWDLILMKGYSIVLFLTPKNINSSKTCLVSALREKRSTVVAQLKQLQSETEPIVKMFEDPETTRQMQSTRFHLSRFYSIITLRHCKNESKNTFLSSEKLIWCTYFICDQGWKDALWLPFRETQCKFSSFTCFKCSLGSHSL